MALSAVWLTSHTLKVEHKKNKARVHLKQSVPLDLQGNWTALIQDSKTLSSGTRLCFSFR